MSRFANLEFAGEPHQGRPAAPPAREEDRLLGQARTAFEDTEFESALRLFAKAIKDNPQRPEAWTGQVRALLELGEYDEASLWADKALERFPAEPELLAAKAVALSRLGDLDGALTFSDSAMQEPGETPYTWLARGDVLLARTEKRADFCFEKALALAPRDWAVAWLAGRIRAFHRQFTLALKLAQQALELRADHAVLWLLAGTCQRELGLVGGARRSLQQALDLNPQLHDARHALLGLEQAGLGTYVGGWWRRCFGGKS